MKMHDYYELIYQMRIYSECILIDGVQTLDALQLVLLLILLGYVKLRWNSNESNMKESLLRLANSQPVIKKLASVERSSTLQKQKCVLSYVNLLEIMENRQ